MLQMRCVHDDVRQVACQFDLDLLTSFDARSPGGGGVLSIDDGVQTFRAMVAEGTASAGWAVVGVKLRLEPGAERGRHDRFGERRRHGTHSAVDDR